MWICPKCNRTFGKSNQPHSCKTIPFEEHFQNKEYSLELFNYLLKKIEGEVGKCKVVSLPCCIHLVGGYDFLAALPKKDYLEIRISLDRVLKSSVLKTSIPVSKKYYKNCIEITDRNEINNKIISWIKESYFLKDLV